MTYHILSLPRSVALLQRPPQGGEHGAILLASQLLFQGNVSLQVQHANLQTLGDFQLVGLPQSYP